MDDVLPRLERYRTVVIDSICSWNTCLFDVDTRSLILAQSMRDVFVGSGKALTNSVSM